MSDICVCLLGETALTQTEADDEQKITLVAVRLALLEKTSSGLATMAFIWATVVILGGFASTIQARDFWFATIISLIEGTRIVRRSSELEWRHKATSKVPLVPYTKMLFTPEKVSELFFWLQLLLAFPCIGLSLSSLVLQSYGDVSKSAFNIFYGLSLADALLYLLEKAYWYRKIFKKNLLCDVTEKYGFTADKFDNFFYDTYSLCIKESVLDGLKMEFVSYSVELLLSSDDDKQLRGAQVLPKLLEKHYAKTLSAIRAKGDVPTRLIEMLNRYGNQEFRSPAAEIISKLVEKIPSFIRFKAISGSIESIGSLLSEEERSEIHSAPRQDANDEFNEVGLQILKSMAADNENCAEIGSSRCLLPKITRFIKSNNSNMETDAKALLREIAKMRHVLDDLIKMLMSMDHHQWEIRDAAAKVISYLVKNNWNGNRLMAIPGSINFIESLLYDNEAIETHRKQYGDQSSGADDTSEHSRRKAYDYTALSLLGLKILKSLVKCGADTESILGLSPKLIGFIKSNQHPIQIKPVRRALKLFNAVMKKYPQIWDKKENGTLGISDLEEILQYQEEPMPDLQILAIETLMVLPEKGISLSSSDNGALCNLFSLFSIAEINTKEKERLVEEAGKALCLLSRHSKDNCQQMLSTKLGYSHSNLIEWLISGLDHPLRGIIVMKILSNLCGCAGTGEISVAAAKVLGFVMNKEGDHQEAAIGLLAEIFNLITKSGFDRVLEESSGVTTVSLLSKLLEVFRQRPSNKIRMTLSTGLLKAVIQKDTDAISRSMSKEAKENLGKKLEGWSMLTEIFSFL